MADIILDTCRWVESELSAEILCPGLAAVYVLDIWLTNKQVYLTISKRRPALLSFLLAFFCSFLHHR